MTEWRNRIIENRIVTADELRANELNWRQHPQRQNEALRGVLSQVGIAAPLIAYYDSNHILTLIDGHLRLETGGEWPCAILDVTDAEAKLLLAVFDPLTALVEIDAAILDALLREVQTDDAVLQGLLAELAEDAGLYGDRAEAPEEFTEYDEDIETKYCCPKCGYEWSGKPN